MVFEQSCISTSEKPNRRIDLLSDIGTVRSFGEHFFDFIEHPSGFLYSHEDFIFSFREHCYIDYTGIP